ncbi:TPA_asm: ATP-binding cassette domain-containing protein, partial [Salmonella enterica subsp. enterica]|nr:ATP-binding cassette domain-containing protein [Salmonella enterica subsp. enterica]
NYNLSARGIYHQYDKLAPLVLVNINIDISENETVLLTGDSGSGKSTFINIMLGITEPVAGSLFIGGVNIKKTGKHAIREITSSVLQGDSLFPGTIYENITFNDSLDNIDQIHEIANAIGIHDVITRLPLGYFTQVGDMSDFLSGGEKQKLLIMRALFKKPKILILDEADSNLDIFSEKKVFDVIMNYKCTKIIVSHKNERTYPVDRIIHFRKGEVIAIRNSPPGPIHD